MQERGVTELIIKIKNKGLNLSIEESNDIAFFVSLMSTILFSTRNSINGSD